jgi:hypothetical protein
VQRKPAHLWTLSAALFAAFAMLAAAPLPSAWKHWHYSRAIELTPTDAARLVSVVAPSDMYVHAKPWLADVRVIDDLVRKFRT